MLHSILDKPKVFLNEDGKTFGLIRKQKKPGKIELRLRDLCGVSCFELADGFFFLEGNTDIIEP